MKVKIGDHLLIRGDFWDTKPAQAVQTVVTDPPFEVYARAWAAKYLNQIPAHTHNLVFSKQPHTHRINYWIEELYRRHKFLNDYIWSFTDGASYRDKYKPLMHHETIAVFTDDKQQINMEAMREPQRTPGAKRKYSTNKHRGKKGKDAFWEPHPDGSWRSSVIAAQRSMTGSLIKSDLPIGVKPVKLLYDLLGGFGGPVFDGFMGTGTTGVACARLGIPFIGIEKESETFDIAVERISSATDDLFS